MSFLLDDKQIFDISLYKLILLSFITFTNTYLVNINNLIIFTNGINYPISHHWIIIREDPTYSLQRDICRA